MNNTDELKAELFLYAINCHDLHKAFLNFNLKHGTYFTPKDLDNNLSAIHNLKPHKKLL